MGLNIQLWLIELELDQMSKYLDLVGNSINQRLEDIELAYRKEAIREMTTDEAAIFNDHWIDEYLDVGKDFPQLLLMSFVIAWYAFVEQQLLMLCDDLNLTITIGPRDETRFDKGIRRARKFLIEAKKYTIEESHWQELVMIGKLRNVLVHEGKDIPRSYLKPEKQFVPYILHIDEEVTVFIKIREDIYQYLNKYEMIEHSGAYFEVRPSFEYCNHLIKFGKDFFSKLYSDLYSK